MTYPTLPDPAYLQPNSHHRRISKSHSSSVSPSSADPITPEINTRYAPSLRRASVVSADDDEIECRWATCEYRATSADELYDHLCNIHVGRKSTNDLCLTCGWEGCGVKCVKRDHITSHLRGEQHVFRFEEWLTLN
jgi:hypothetical protein